MIHESTYLLSCSLYDFDTMVTKYYEYLSHFHWESSNVGNHLEGGEFDKFSPQVFDSWVFSGRNSWYPAPNSRPYEFHIKWLYGRKNST